MSDDETRAGKPTGLEYRAAAEVSRWAREGTPISKAAAEMVLAHARREGGPDAHRYAAGLLKGVPQS